MFPTIKKLLGVNGQKEPMVYEVAAVLTKELKGETMVAFGPSDNDLLSKSDIPKSYKISDFSISYYDVDDNGTANIGVFVKLIGYDADKSGHIYTGKTFLNNIKALIRKTSLSKWFKDANYAELAMQDRKSVHLVLTMKLKKSAGDEMTYSGRSHRSY